MLKLTKPRAVVLALIAGVATAQEADPNDGRGFHGNGHHRRWPAGYG